MDGSLSPLAQDNLETTNFAAEDYTSSLSCTYASSTSMSSAGSDHKRCRDEHLEDPRITTNSSLNHHDDQSYNISWGLRLTGRVQADVLCRSLHTIVARHESLRTVIASDAGAPYLKFLDAAVFDTAREDLSALPADARPAQAQRLADEWVKHRFRLNAEPMMRAKLLKLSEEEHWLVVVLHHIAADGWSLGIFERELSELYRAYSAHEEPRLAELSVQYADFAAWQRQATTQEVLDHELAYWKQQLADLPALLELPTDHPRPRKLGSRGAVLQRKLDARLTAALRQLSLQENASLFMTLLAGWQVLLGRYSGQDDIAVGTPIAGRNHQEVEGLIGFFVNTLVLRSNLSENPPFRTLLEQVRKTTLDGFDHQQIPFEKLVAELNPERSESHSPLFQVLFALQNAPEGNLSLTGMTCERLSLDTQTSKFDLTLLLTEESGALAAILEYNTALFTEATMSRLWDHYQTLLEGIVLTPEKPISQLPLMSDAERRQVVVEWNQTDAPFPAERSLDELFEEQAARTPDAIAVVCGDQQLTYRQLNQQANRLACLLQQHHIQPDDRIGLFTERSLEMIVGLLAILKAGAAYVPIDPEYPADRVDWILKDSGSIVVVASLALRDQLPAQSPVIFLDDPALQTELESAPGHNRPLSPDDAVSRSSRAAYVIYTSGSTGQPKGVVITHANVARLFSATDPWFHFQAGEVWTLFHSIAFDFSVWELWGALIYGGRVVVVPWHVARSPNDFLKLLVDERVTILNQTPAAFYALLRANQDDPEMGRRLNLRYVIFGGEALDLARLDEWYQLHADDAPQLINMYGITETTVHVTYRPLNRAFAKSARGSLIGTRIPDLRLYVLDRHGEPVPVGVPGELHVAGTGLARGYLNQPDLTAEKFIPDRFSGDLHERLYRTGDLVRWIGENELEYLGRIDTQVKLRGFRIELGEIESQLRTLFSLREAVVLLREDVPGDKRLVAYLVPDQTHFDSSELRNRLATRLPNYMLPAAFVILDKIPLTNNGKIDRRRLPEPELTTRSVQDEAIPTTPLEKLTAQCWQDLLGIEQVSRHDDFFAIGGHSLLAARVVARIKAETGAIISTRDVFDASIFSEFVALIAKRTISASPESADTALPTAFKAPSSASVNPDSFDADATMAEISAQPSGSVNIEQLNPLAYCDIYAPVISGRVPIAVVGDRRPLSLLKTRTRPPVPLLHMGLDGVHVFPTLYLTFEQQIEIYVRALEHRLPERRVALIGFSYGATLACRLASVLEERGWRQVEIMLIEPFIPDTCLPISKRLRKKFKRLLLDMRKKYDDFFDDSEAQVLDELENSSEGIRWSQMEPFILKIAASANWRPLKSRMVLAGCDEYLKNFADSCRLICPAGLEICRFSGATSHTACFKEPYLSQWRSRFKKFIMMPSPANADPPTQAGH